MSAPLRRALAAASAVALAAGTVLIVASSAHAADFDTPPVWSISGSNVNMPNMQTIYVGSDGTTYVSDVDTESILEWAPGSTGNIAQRPS